MPSSESHLSSQVGGGYIYVREDFKDRLEIIASSWAIANSDGQDEMNDTDTVEGEKAQATQENQETQDATKSPLDALRHTRNGRRLRPSGQFIGLGIGRWSQGPRSCFSKVCRRASKICSASTPLRLGPGTCLDVASSFKAWAWRMRLKPRVTQVMGLGDREWMYEILKSFDAPLDSFGLIDPTEHVVGHVFGGLMWVMDWLLEKKGAQQLALHTTYSGHRHPIHRLYASCLLYLETAAKDRQERLELVSLARGVRRDQPTLRQGVHKRPIVRV